MKRRKFLTMAAVTTMLLTSAKNLFGYSNAKTGFVLKKGKNRFDEHTILIGNSPVDIKVSGMDTGGTLTVSEYTGNTKGGPPLHIHPTQDEVFYVLEGEHLFQLGDQLHRLYPGDTIFIPRNTPHAPAQLSEKGKYLFFLRLQGKWRIFSEL